MAELMDEAINRKLAELLKLEKEKNEAKKAKEDKEIKLEVKEE